MNESSASRPGFKPLDFSEVRTSQATRQDFSAVRFIRTTSRAVYVSKLYVVKGGSQVSERGGVEIIPHHTLDHLVEKWGPPATPDTTSVLYINALRQLARTLSDAALDNLE
jgi:hypothetical protein